MKDIIHGKKCKLHPVHVYSKRKDKKSGETQLLSLFFTENELWMCHLVQHVLAKYVMLVRMIVALSKAEFLFTSFCSFCTKQNPVHPHTIAGDKG